MGIDKRFNKNETIRYATNEKRKDREKETRLNQEINLLNEQIQNANNQNTI